MTGSAVVSETDEARELREAYNARNGGHTMQSAGSGASDSDYIALVCPPGVVWVNLKELEEQERQQVPVVPTTSPVVRRLSALVGAGAPAGSGPHLQRQSSSLNGGGQSGAGGRGLHFSGALIAHLPRVRRVWGQRVGDDAGGRRRRSYSRKGGEAEPGSSTGADGSMLANGAQSKANEELVALELLQHAIEPKTSAEDAKAAATHSAMIRESYVAHELQVRQMWRVVMGNAPGLKAEIAKLHATERAKLALRQFELDAAARRNINWQATRRPDSPQQASPPADRRPSPQGYQTLAVSAQAVESSSSRHALGSKPSARGSSRDTQPEGRGGLFGWFNPRRPEKPEFDG